MPKSAPTQVIVHRIELQETERRMIETAIAAYSVRNVTKGIFNLTSDLTTVIVLIIAYEWISGKTILDDAFIAALGAGSGIADALIDNWRNYRSTQEYAEDYDERATSVTGGLRNLLDQIIDALTGGPIDRLHRQWEENPPGE
jgi:hypothetical protein